MQLLWSYLVLQGTNGPREGLPVVTRFFWPPEMPLIISEPTGMSAQTCKTGMCDDSLMGAIIWPSLSIMAQTTLGVLLRPLGALSRCLHPVAITVHAHTPLILGSSSFAIHADSAGAGPHIQAQNADDVVCDHGIALP